MDVSFQNTRGALNAAARRLARDDATLEFISDEYDEVLDDGTFPADAAFTLPYKAYFTGDIMPEQIQRLASAGQTIQNGATMTIPEAIDRYAQRVFVRGFWWKVVEQATNEGVTNFTLDKVSAEPGGVYE